MLITVVTIAIAVSPLVLTLFLRTNGALAFLSLCAGSVLVKYAGDDVTLIASALFRSNGSTDEIARLLLLGVPMIMTLLLFRRTTQTRHMLLQLLSAAFAGLAALILVQPILNADVQTQVAATSLSINVRSYEGFIFALGVIVSTFTLWVSRSKHGSDHGRKKGKH